MTVTKLFHSREDRISDMLGEDSKVQYVNIDEDVERIEKSSDYFEECVDDLRTAITDYEDSLVEYVEDQSDENRAGMDLCRAELVENWATTQVALSQLAHVLRIDGNEAFHRSIDGLQGKTYSMAGL